MELAWGKVKVNGRENLFECIAVNGIPLILDLQYYKLNTSELQSGLFCCILARPSEGLFDMPSFYALRWPAIGLKNVDVAAKMSRLS
jgi:hypothetical protein